MRSPTYYKVRTMVRALFWIGVGAVIYYLATHINWTGDGFCWGTIAECLFD